MSPQFPLKLLLWGDKLIELPPQLNEASLPGLHLRVGQRFGAFSHSAFVNVIPGQVPVTFGVQLGLGLNIFGKQQTSEASKDR